MSTYDPREQRILLGRQASLYARAHEEAHAEQHRLLTRAWRANDRMSRVPYLCRFARLWVEWEACSMALHAMDLRGERTHASEREARKALWTYVWALFGW